MAAEHPLPHIVAVHCMLQLAVPVQCNSSLCICLAHSWPIGVELMSRSDELARRSAPGTAARQTHMQHLGMGLRLQLQAFTDRRRLEHLKLYQLVSVRRTVVIAVSRSRGALGSCESERQTVRVSVSYRHMWTQVPTVVNATLSVLQLESWYR